VSNWIVLFHTFWIKNTFYNYYSASHINSRRCWHYQIQKIKKFHHKRWKTLLPKIKIWKRMERRKEKYWWIKVLKGANSTPFLKNIFFTTWSKTILVLYVKIQCFRQHLIKRQSSKWYKHGENLVELVNL